ncbi:MAG: glycosyltransferase family 1 protein [Bacteroidales bacterium]|jgi:glycosyltransferase involved in cell wall biosynthesis|nr:glycosyltransferase family 1 protein [Bacteroidales bacterium]
MRIGIEGQRLFRLEKHGMDIVAIELIKQLQQIDLENEYFIFVKDGDADQWFTPTDNFHLVRTKKAAYHIWEQIILPREVKRHKIDILHCTSNTAPMWLKIPLVLTLHDIIYLENFKFVSFQSTLYQLMGNFYRRWVVPSNIKTAKRIITVSHTEKDIIAKRFPKLGSNLMVIYNSISDSFLEIDKSKFPEFKKRYNLPANYIFTLGNTSPKKNFPNVLRAYIIYHTNTSNPLPLILADEPPTDGFTLMGVKIPVDVEKDIRFIGYVDNKEIPLLYAFSRVFIYASLRESFGIPILEGMAAGTPVITSNTSCMPEIAGDGGALVNPEKPEEIAAKIGEIVNNSDLANRLKIKGKKRVEYFSWKNSAIQLLEIYKTLYSEIKA